MLSGSIAGGVVDSGRHLLPVEAELITVRLK